MELQRYGKSVRSKVRRHLSLFKIYTYKKKNQWKWQILSKSEPQYQSSGLRDRCKLKPGISFSTLTWYIKAEGQQNERRQEKQALLEGHTLGFGSRGGQGYPIWSSLYSKIQSRREISRQKGVLELTLKDLEKCSELKMLLGKN